MTLSVVELRVAVASLVARLENMGVSRSEAMRLVALDNGLSPAYVAWVLSGHWPVRRSREVTTNGTS